MTKPLPPARLSESVFRRFEPTIAKAVENFPSAIRLETKTPNSIACQLRAAMKSYSIYKWPSVIPRITFDTLYATNLVVREFDSFVLIGSRQSTKLGLASKSCSFSEPHLAESSLEIVDIGQTCFAATVVMAHLASIQALAKRIRLTLTPSQAQELTSNHDILLEPVENKPNEYILS